MGGSSTCSSSSHGHRQRVGGVRAADHDQLGSERAKPLNLLHALDSLIGVDSASRRPVQQPVLSCLGYRPQVLTLTARKIQAGPDQGMRRRERAVLAVADDQPTTARQVGPQSHDLDNHAG
jgi:hypothetical protein